MRILLDWVASNLAKTELFHLHNQRLQRESQVIIRSAGYEIPFRRVNTEIASQLDVTVRHSLDEARARALQDTSVSLAAEYLERERDIQTSIGIAATYAQTWETLKGFPLSTLRRQAEQFLTQTEQLWNDVRDRALEISLNVRADKATSADAQGLFRGRAYDQFFTADSMMGAAAATLQGMGFDIQAGGRVIIDSVDRPGKMPRAACGPVRVPDEIYVVVLPGAGHRDWLLLMHELGHAMHFAHIDADAPVEYRRFGDLSVTETFAALFESLFQEEAWLLEHTELQRGAREYARFASLSHLHFLRRYCSKFLFELGFYDGQRSRQEESERFAEILSRGTGFRYRTVDAFLETDPGIVSAMYLRAHQAAQALITALKREFGQQCWTDRRSGEWLRTTFLRHGMRYSAEDIAMQAGGQQLDFGPLTQSFSEKLSDFSHL